MTFALGHRPAQTGKITTTRPLQWDEIQQVKEVVAKSPRDKALLSLFLGTGLRASDARSLRWSDMKDDGSRYSVLIRQQKTGKLKQIVLSPEVSADLRDWQQYCAFDYVASGLRGQLSVGSLGRLTKDWVAQAGLDVRHIGSHSLRKSRALALIDHFKEPLYLVMRDLGHHSELQTCAYLGITTKDQARLYSYVL